MRVLIAVAVAVAALPAGACFSPEVGDCQFRCGAGGVCPAGTRCMTGFCRTATGGCPAVQDACQKQPPPNNCGDRIILDGGAACMVQCTNARSWADSRNECVRAGWQLGILDSPDRIAQVAGADTYWVGASRDMPLAPWEWLSGEAVTAETWTGGTPPVAGESCAAFSGATRKLSNDLVCTDNQQFICTYPP